MLQQTELIFDFASDHHCMAQVSKCQALMLHMTCARSDKLTTYLNLCVLQLGSYLDYPAVSMEQVPHSQLLFYTGLACEQSDEAGDHQQLLKGQATHDGTHAAAPPDTVMSLTITEYGVVWTFF